MQKEAVLRVMVGGVRGVFQRFPIPGTLAILAAATSLTMLHTHDAVPSLRGVLMMLALGFPLFVAFALMRTSYRLSQRTYVILLALGTAFLLLYYLLLPHANFDSPDWFGEVWIRYILWLIAFGTVITVAPFLRTEYDPVRFWLFNKRLVFGMVISAIWGAVVFAGIALAFASLDFLFGVSVSGERYIEVGILVSHILVPFSFLARIPDPRTVTSEITPPAEVYRFARFVLVPLSVLYFIILYAYIIRIIVRDEWPSARLVYLIVGLAATGVVSHLLLLPFELTERWVRIWIRFYYIALIPHIGMLFWSVWWRVSLYGWTVNRYLVAALGVWLLLLAIVFALRARNDARIIPATFFMIVVLISFGPWGAFDVARRSQLHRLSAYLEHANLLHGGTITPAEREEDISYADRYQMSSIIRYLVTMHGIESVRPIFGDALSRLSCDHPAAWPIVGAMNPPVSCSRYNLPEAITRQILGFAFVWGERPRSVPFYWIEVSANEPVIDITEYHRYVEVKFSDSRPVAAEESSGEAHLVIDADRGAFRVTLPDLPVTYIVPYEEAIVRAFETQPEGGMIRGRVNIPYVDDTVSMLISLDSMSARRDVRGSIVPDHVSADIFYTPRDR